MLFNCALNPLNAILNVKYGKLAEWIFIEHYWSANVETFEVMEKPGYKTNWSGIDEYNEIFFNQFFSGA